MYKKDSDVQFNLNDEEGRGAACHKLHMAIHWHIANIVSSDQSILLLFNWQPKQLT